MGIHNITSYVHHCRIDVNFVIKVADFGLAESIELSKTYFRQCPKDAVKLPIKWLAPESINDGVFSEKSDVVRNLSTAIATAQIPAIIVVVWCDLLGDTHRREDPISRSPSS